MKSTTSMIEFQTGDILKSNSEALVNTVNCVGVMGRGIALQFKSAYPQNYEEYKRACDHNEVVPGKMLIHETGTLTNPRYIINFPTKRHWKGKSRIEDIDKGLDALVADIKRYKIESISIPPLGSGLGGLPWEDVRSLILEKLRGVDVRVVIYEPSYRPLSVKAPKVPSMTPSRASMILLIDEYLSTLMEPIITLLEVHKLMYFMQEAGEPLRLEYSKNTYGPYARNLSFVLKAIEGYFIEGYRDGGDEPYKPLNLLPGAIEDAKASVKDNEATEKNLQKVSKLVSGFETAFGLELLATVHWVITRDKVIDDKVIERKVYAWAGHKKKFSPRQIRIAHKTLLANGWV
jgi:O-acetyl-ADP-ribose deacetylase (regulator of RNase III)